MGPDLKLQVIKVTLRGDGRSQKLHNCRGVGQTVNTYKSVVNFDRVDGSTCVPKWTFDHVSDKITLAAVCFAGPGDSFFCFPSYHEFRMIIFKKKR